jgi:hypothetical protein
MSKTLIKKKVLNDTAGAEAATDGLGLIDYADLSVTVQGLFVDNNVKVTASDTTTGNLSAKLAAGTGMDFDVTNPAGNEQLTVNSLGQARITAADTTHKYLIDCLTAGTDITLTKNNTGANENIEIAATLSSHIGLHLGWIYEIEASASIRVDETAYNLDSVHLNAYSLQLKHIIHRPDTAAAGSLGLIQSIGKNEFMPAEQWAAIHGLLFCFTVEDDNWFNLKNDATVADTDYRKIVTGTDGDLYFLKSALMAYDNDAECWYVISYTRATWQRLDTFTGVGNSDILVAANLPQIGYYHFDVYGVVDENNENTSTQQTLTIKCTGTALEIDQSANMSWIGAAGGVWCNRSLQGSGLIYVSDAAIADRDVYLNAYLPNYALPTIEGYIHLIYLGRNIEV